MSKNTLKDRIKFFLEDNEDIVIEYCKRDTMDVYVEDVQLGDKDFYLNNPCIKKANVVTEYSDLQILEYIKCSIDVVYFTEKYIKIISIDDGMIPFKLYGYQKELLRNFQNNRYCISLQCRQSGKTATTAAFLLWFGTFHSEKVIAILANKASQAREIVARITTSLEGLPFFLQAGNKTLNKGSMEFANNSRILSGASSSSSIRGMSISLLYIDEVAFIPNDIEFYESTYPVITSGKKSRVIMTSTPKGARGLFYKIWTEAIEKVNSFVTMKVLWNDVPDRDDAWREETIANTSREQFRQEFECEFMGSSGSLIDSYVLQALPCINTVAKYNNVEIYEEPIKGKEYMIIVDTARGLMQDSSAFVVFDINQIPYKVVAKYKNNIISPLLYPTVIANAGFYYNEAYILVEINDIGEQVANILHYDIEYENLIQCEMSGRNGQVISSGYGANIRMGVRTTVSVKSIGCANAKTMIESDKIILNDLDLINEFGTFVAKGKSYEADKDCHDDLVMCVIIFAWVTQQQYFRDLTDLDTRKKLLEENDNERFEDLSPLPIIDDGINYSDGVSHTQVYDDYGTF